MPKTATIRMVKPAYGFVIKPKNFRPHFQTIYNVLVNRVAQQQGFTLKLNYSL